MGQVIVHVNGHPYTMKCADGEEDHLRDLAQLLDTEVARIRRSVGAIGDTRLLVMAGFMVADRLSEAIKRIEDIEEELRQAQNALDPTVHHGPVGWSVAQEGDTCDSP